jgi:hypothetical protein
MTKLERKALQHAIENSQHPTVRVRSYDFGSERASHTQHTSDANADRLLDSPDYKAGWEACHKAIKETLEFIMSASISDLKRYAR